MSKLTFNRLAFALSSRAVIAGVSSIKIEALDNFPAAAVNFGQSDGDKNPDRTLWASTRAWEHNILCTSCSLDISRLKNATPNFLCNEACSAMEAAKALLPMEGRPATI